jgi:hypothetical protein
VRRSWVLRLVLSYSRKGICERWFGLRAHQKLPRVAGLNYLDLFNCPLGRRHPFELFSDLERLLIGYRFHQSEEGCGVHGCFWHQHRSARCLLRSRPLSHLDYWDAKLKRNEERDTTLRTRSSFDKSVGTSWLFGSVRAKTPNAYKAAPRVPWPRIAIAVRLNCLS